MPSKPIAHFSPGRALLSSFFITILLGTAALCLPWARTADIPFIDILFTATSATCVTGHLTIPLSHFTIFGQFILLLLIQIGGLGLITLSIFLMSLFVNLGLGSQIMASQLMELDSWHYLKRILFFTIGLTCAMECIGATLIYWLTREMFTGFHAVFIAIFHAVSSFCNAGISIVGENMELFAHSPSIILITLILILIGGLGFITWYEIMQYIISLRKKKRYSFSLHSKIILLGSSLLIVLSTIALLILEKGHAFAHTSPAYGTLYALFHAVAFRSTGFTLVPITTFGAPILVLIMAICFIGSSPGSTGSGIKITTFFIYLATIRAAVMGESTVVIKGRTIASDQVLKVIAIVSLSFAWIATTTLCLLITEPEWSFLPLFFEAVSAFATLGLSLNVTPTLSFIGKCLIMMSMIIGRIGSLTLIVTLRQATIRSRHKKIGISYPEERVMLS